MVLLAAVINAYEMLRKCCLDGREGNSKKESSSNLNHQVDGIQYSGLRFQNMAGTLPHSLHKFVNLTLLLEMNF